MCDARYLSIARFAVEAGGLMNSVQIFSGTSFHIVIIACRQSIWSKPLAHQTAAPMSESHAIDGTSDPSMHSDIDEVELSTNEKSVMIVRLHILSVHKMLTHSQVVGSRTRAQDVSFDRAVEPSP